MQHGTKLCIDALITKLCIDALIKKRSKNKDKIESLFFQRYSWKRQTTMTTLCEKYPWFAIPHKNLKFLRKKLARIEKSYNEEIRNCYKTTDRALLAAKLDTLRMKREHDRKMNILRSSKKVYLYLQRNFHKMYYSRDAKIQQFITFTITNKDQLLSDLNKMILVEDGLYTQKEKKYMNITKTILENYGNFKENYGVTIKLHINRLCYHDVANRIYSYL